MNRKIVSLNFRLAEYLGKKINFTRQHEPSVSIKGDLYRFNYGNGRIEMDGIDFLVRIALYMRKYTTCKENNKHFPDTIFEISKEKSDRLEELSGIFYKDRRHGGKFYFYVDENLYFSRKLLFSYSKTTNFEVDIEKEDFENIKDRKMYSINSRGDVLKLGEISESLIRDIEDYPRLHFLLVNVILNKFEIAAECVSHPVEYLHYTYILDNMDFTADSYKEEDIKLAWKLNRDIKPTIKIERSSETKKVRVIEWITTKDIVEETCSSDSKSNETKIDDTIVVDGMIKESQAETGSSNDISKVDEKKDKIILENKLTVEYDKKDFMSSSTLPIDSIESKETVNDSKISHDEKQITFEDILSRRTSITDAEQLKSMVKNYCESVLSEIKEKRPERITKRNDINKLLKEFVKNNCVFGKDYQINFPILYDSFITQYKDRIKTSPQYISTLMQENYSDKITILRVGHTTICFGLKFI